MKKWNIFFEATKVNIRTEIGVRAVDVETDTTIINY